MTTKGPSYKQIIVPMSKEAANKYIKDASAHIISINSTLKLIKSVIVDFIRTNDRDIVISTNNIASPADLQEIKKIVKNLLQDNEDKIDSPQLLQSKFYLKIIGIPYLNNQTNTCISSKDIEKILKKNHIFNDVILTSKPRVIKVSPKSDMTIIWINIWDMQNGSNAKKIINKHFNVGSYIAMVYKANINPEAHKPSVAYSPNTYSP